MVSEIKSFIKRKKFEEANQLLTKSLSHQGCVQYAIFAAELVLPLFESMYPRRKAPRKAIQSAKDWLENPCEKTRLSADKATEAAFEAADKVIQDNAAKAHMAARVTAWASGSAAKAASGGTAWAAIVTTRAAGGAAGAAAMEAAEDDSKKWIQILNYGLKLLEPKSVQFVMEDK